MTHQELRALTDYELRMLSLDVKGELTSRRRAARIAVGEAKLQGKTLTATQLNARAAEILRDPCGLMERK
jgi:hypothetical protein